TGVVLSRRANNNTIGEGNVISGNSQDGILIEGGIDGPRDRQSLDRPHDNRVVGNFIGTDIHGAFVVGNGKDGVEIDNGAYLNTVGDVGREQRNVIAGNHEYQIHVHGLGSDVNTVQSNYVGTDVTGTWQLEYSGLSPDLPVGVGIEDGAQGNTVGG